MKLTKALLFASLLASISAQASEEQILKCDTRDGEKVNVEALFFDQNSVIRVSSARNLTGPMMGQIGVERDVATAFIEGNIDALVNQQINGEQEGRLLIRNVGQSFSGQSIYQVEMTTDSHPLIPEIRSVDLVLQNCIVSSVSDAKLAK